MVDQPSMTPVDATLPQPTVADYRGSSAQLTFAHGVVIPLGADQTLIVGTDPSAGLPLRDPYVSFRHAAIRRDGLGFHIEDLRSTNGTYVDGVRIEQAWAGPGSRLRVGNQRLDIVGEEASSQTAAPLLGQSPRFRSMLRHLRILARVRPPVLVHGETGTGKELAARALHEWGPRAAAPFVAINCASMTDALVESTLFGHVRGAFTGAHRDQPGAFVEATGGTLFLDEIGELPLVQQAKLLRVLELGRITPVGSTVERRVDVRIVAATHRHLTGMVARGQFREDLYHRLSVLDVHLPALRERREDIPLLLDHFCRRASEELERRVWLSDAAIEAARQHSWPGNVRALRNAVLRAATLSDGPIGPADLLGGAPLCGAPLCPPPSVAQDHGPPTLVHVPRGDYVTMRRAMLQQLVNEHGSIRKAAAVLRIPRSTLGAWLKSAPASRDPAESV